ncbi:MAG: hypothetical protein HY815_30880 [Candidatus Riflebacteria bacterium]|nr:hypothetical protein [Candidatus Riflebacteria bacterium]
MAGLLRHSRLFVSAPDELTVRALARATTSPTAPRRSFGPNQCIVCGGGRKVTTTACCDLPICDDWAEFVPYSDPVDCCSRSHDRYTLCGYHHSVGHDGDWVSCRECWDAFPSDLYACFAENRFNLPSEVPLVVGQLSRCDACGREVSLLAESFWAVSGELICSRCGDRDEDDAADAFDEFLEHSGDDTGGGCPSEDHARSQDHGDDEIPF